MSEVLLKQIKEQKAYQLLDHEFKAMKRELQRRNEIKERQEYMQSVSVLVAISNKLDAILAE